MRTVSADYIFPANRQQIKNGIVQFDDDGNILFVGSQEEFSGSVDEQLSGAICPGFINTHCHLELSFMYNKIPTHTGLIEFIAQVVATRDDMSEEEQQKMIAWGEQQMVENGIVAVGDISNDTRSFATKQASKLRFHTFVELFDFQPAGTLESIAKGKEVFSASPKQNGNTASITPHAPYSCTPTLVNFCDRFSAKYKPLLSIHNQEHPQENQYYQDKSGAWQQLFSNWSIDQSWVEAPGKTSLQAMGEYLSGENQIIYVHNTFTSAADVQWATDHLQSVYFCSCPNANLYIENRLPDYQLLINAGAIMCLGTDSLASNWQYSILEEMKTIQQRNEEISTEELVKWGCWNGAKALFFDQELGSLEVGKQPGIVHISALDAQGNLTEHSKAKRLDS